MLDSQDKHKVYIGMGISNEQYKRNIEHYNGIKDKIEITGGGCGYAHHTYTGRVLDTSLITDEVALICDKGNLCFGYSGHVNSDGTFSIKVYTD